MSSKPLVLVIGGPTASGKTRLAIELAKALGGEIISADSRQVYKYMDVGAAKATPEERAEATHHLIDFLEPDENYSAGQFAKDATKTIQQIIARGSFPIICGGTGLYIEALTEGLREGENPTQEIRDLVRKIAEDDGKEGLISLLKKIDPEALELYPDGNPSRLIRAIEYFYTTGNKFSQGIKIRKKTGEFDFLFYGLYFEREILYSRINARAEHMWKNGLLAETEQLLAMGFDETYNSLNTVGYKEAIAYIRGTMRSEESLELMKRNTRRYAKRQMTWFRNRTALQFMEGEFDSIVKKILGNVNKLI